MNQKPHCNSFSVNTVSFYGLRMCLSATQLWTVPLIAKFPVTISRILVDGLMKISISSISMLIKYVLPSCRQKKCYQEPIGIPRYPISPWLPLNSIALIQFSERGLIGRLSLCVPIVMTTRYWMTTCWTNGRIEWLEGLFKSELICECKSRPWRNPQMPVQLTPRKGRWKFQHGSSMRTRRGEWVDMLAS